MRLVVSTAAVPASGRNTIRTMRLHVSRCLPMFAVFGRLRPSERLGRKRTPSFCVWKGRRFWTRGNDSFSDSHPKAVFACSARGGSGSAVLPQDCSRKAQKPRRLGWFVGFGQKVNLICHLCLHKSISTEFERFVAIRQMASQVQIKKLRAEKAVFLVI